LDGTRIVTQLGNDTGKLCRWLETTLGLVAGATPTTGYVSGTWFVKQCLNGESMALWGSPDLCDNGLPAGNGLECQTFTVSQFETCIKALVGNLCVLGLDTVPECTKFNLCYPQIVVEA
jgi:hypothetical protein